VTRYFLLVPLIASWLSAAPAYVREDGLHRWRIGNDHLERTISFSEKDGLRTEALLYKLTGRDFTSYSREHQQFGDEFGFTANDKKISGRHALTFGRAHVSDLSHGKQLTIELTHSEPALHIYVHYVVYDDHAAVRKWISVENTGSAEVYLKGFHFEALFAGPGAPADLQVTAGYGALPQARYFTGRVSDCCTFIRNAGTGEGMAVINEAPGYLKRTEIGSGWTEGFQVMYDTDLFPFGRTVRPKETFESARSSIILFADQRQFADAGWSVPRYLTQVVARRQPAAPPRWLYNTWEPFQRRIDQATIAELAPTAHAMGIDIFTIDDGWQADYGSNKIEMSHFPQGMAGIRSLLDANHLSLGLWVPLAAISTKTADYLAHPEWACRQENGAPKFTDTASGQSAVMCLASGYREAAVARFDELISSFHPAYIKVDLTTVFNAYGEQPGCYAKGHQHRDWAESLTRIYEALEYIGQQIYKRHPEVLIDYTFELWGEKHLIDPALLTAADLDWLSNIADEESTDGGAREARMLLYQRAPSIPAESMLIGNLHAATTPIEERFAIAISSGPLFLGDLRKLTAADKRFYAEKIAWFKALRNRAALSDSFFPLGEWRQPGGKSWDGLARLSRNSDGIVVLFKNQSQESSAHVQLPAPPQAEYRARSILTGADLGSISAADLAKGWNVPFAADHPTQIIELRRVGSGTGR